MKVGVNVGYRLPDIISGHNFEDLMENFFHMTGVSCLVKYADGYIYNVSCLKFEIHEKQILSQINRGNELGVYRDKNGLVYIGIPIVVNGKRAATVFLNPIFLEGNHKNKNFRCFRGNIRIPVVSKKNINEIINFFYNEFTILAELEYRNNILGRDYKKFYGMYNELYKVYCNFKLHYNEMKKIAYYDKLTKLYNFNYFTEKIEKQIEMYPEDNFSIFQIELNNFKSINDIFGYEYGDKLLKKIGNTLRKMKIGMVSRTGGDGFLLLKREINGRIELENLAQHIIDDISGLWVFSGNEVLVSVNIGITVFPKDGRKVAKLLRNVDVALNRAKLTSKNSYVIFEKYMYDEILEKTELERELRKALKNNEFILYYQPQVDIKTRDIVGFEALIRWDSPKLGWVMPQKFISLAEETGLIVPIGDWVLKTACMQNKLWKNKGYSYDFISVNVSTVQLKDNNFIDTVRDTLKETGLKPECLEVEITESVMMESFDWSLQVITELKDMGIKVALDDFGSGYSSLNYLKSIPINTLKIDKTFIDGICKGSYENIITGEIIELAHKMELEVVAEGVEMEEQISYLKEKNCNKIQGYYFGKPMPSECINMLLEEKKIKLDN
ncbi:MAG TPA: histidine kinase [Clostridium sp.]|jgi:diguanylate cyclase (GGDEF)-like protein|nr:histidine kinase [Clostridium sp.]